MPALLASTCGQDWLLIHEGGRNMRPVWDTRYPRGQESFVIHTDEHSAIMKTHAPT